MAAAERAAEVWHGTFGPLTAKASCPCCCRQEIRMESYGIDWEMTYMWPNSDGGLPTIRTNVIPVCTHCVRGCAGRYHLLDWAHIQGYSPDRNYIFKDSFGQREVGRDPSHISTQDVPPSSPPVKKGGKGGGKKDRCLLC